MASYQGAEWPGKPRRQLARPRRRAADADLSEPACVKAIVVLQDVWCIAKLECAEAAGEIATRDPSLACLAALDKLSSNGPAQLHCGVR